jgi:hypothetical protein
MDISPEQLEICLNVLQQISDDPSLIEQHDRLKNLIVKWRYRSSNNRSFPDAQSNSGKTQSSGYWYFRTGKNYSH